MLIAPSCGATPSLTVKARLAGSPTSGLAGVKPSMLTVLAALLTTTSAVSLVALKLPSPATRA